MKDNGAYVDAAIATLRRDLATYIGQENTEAGMPSIPVVPADRFLFGGEEGGPIVSFPAVEVAAPDRSISAFDVAQVAWDTQPTVAVRGWLTYDANLTGFQLLYRGSMRLGRAMIRTLLEQDAFGPSVRVSRVMERYRVDPQTDQRQDFAAFALLVFTLDDIDALDA